MSVTNRYRKIPSSKHLTRHDDNGAMRWSKNLSVSSLLSDRNCSFLEINKYNQFAWLSKNFVIILPNSQKKQIQLYWKPTDIIVWKENDIVQHKCYQDDHFS